MKLAVTEILRVRRYEATTIGPFEGVFFERDLVG